MPGIGILFLMLFAQIAIAIVLTGFEQRYPAGNNPSGRGRLRNFGVGTLLLAMQMVGAVVLAPLTTFVANSAGTGLIFLPASGVLVLVSAAIYFVAMDLGEYLFHRAQHAIPILWKMHSLHHSDTDFNVTTTVRHFWMDPWLKTISMWLAVSVIFKVPTAALTIYSVISFYNFLTHANLRINYGRWSWVLNSPAYHRLHHSREPQHFDRNFAAILPVFDLVLGSYIEPQSNEYPATGIDSNPGPGSVVHVLCWPIRQQ